jgi:hypothetical protein
MQQLARDVLEVAEPVLLHSPVLTPEDCQAIIVERGVCYADILARRGKPVAIVAMPVPAPASRIEATPATTAPAPAAPVAAAPVAAVPVAATAAPPAPSNPPPVAAVIADDTNDNASAIAAEEETTTAEVVTAEEETESTDDTNARELCELFFGAGSAERRLILMNLDYTDWPAGEPSAALQRADVWRMETAALRHNTATVMRELERVLGISYQQSRRIVEDELGEPIVIAGKAMSLPADVLQRIVLFLNPRVGQSIDRVYELAALYNEISVEASRRLVSILRAAEPAGEQKTRDTRAIHGEAEAPRRAPPHIVATPVRTPEAVLRRAAGED